CIRIHSTHIRCVRCLTPRIKERARLYPYQWNNYRKIAEDSGHEPDKSVFAIVAPWENTDDRIKPRSNIFRWTDIYEMADAASKVESDEVGKFLLQEFTTFLAGRKMKPFDAFVQQDIDTISRIPEVGKKLRSFFQDVFNKLSQSQNKKAVIQKGTVEVKTYKDYPELYVWVSFIVRSKLVRSKPLTMWVGINEYQSKGPILGLGVWVTNRMRKKWEKKLGRLGFTWDAAGEGGFVKSLKTELKSSGSDPNLLGSLVHEVQEIMEKVYDRL
ncbi:MAG: hypothetical protein AAB433_18930, partial [Nitrospirota bacterium]